MPPTDATPALRGLTPRELARLLRIGRGRVMAMIRAGELPAVDIGTPGRPRLIVLPDGLAELLRRRAAVTPKPTKRRRRSCPIDFYPD
jgi:excisionase family DNA binding protein